MADVTIIDDLAEALAASVRIEFPALQHTVSTRALPEHSAPPRLVFVPTRDTWGAPQKRPRGGLSTGRALATVQAGMAVHCWGATRTEAWALVLALVRAVRSIAGPEPWASIGAGEWLGTGASTHGEAYVLTLTCAIDAADTPPTVATATASVTTVTTETP